MACNIITPQIENLAKSLGITSVEASNIVSLYQEQVEHKGQFPSVDEAKVILDKRNTGETRNNEIARQLSIHLTNLGFKVFGRDTMEKFLQEHKIEDLQQAIDNSNINDSLAEEDKEDILKEIKKINRAKRTLIDIGGNFLFLIDHTDREGLESLTEKQQKESFLCKAKIDITGLDREDIIKIKNIIKSIINEEGISATLQTLGKELERNGFGGRLYNSDSIVAEVRSTNANNAGLYNETQSGKSFGRRSDKSSSENLGTGFIRVYGNDGTNRPRYIPINNQDDVEFFTTPQGEVYGFVDKEGNIYLDETKISPEHPIHEYTHLWDRVVAERNPELWKRGVELMKQTSLWKEMSESESYGKLWRKKGITGERLDNLIASEVHARFVGEGGAKLLDDIAKEKGQGNIISKLRQWILDFWKNLKETFGNWSKSDLDKLTLKDFNHMTVRDFTEDINLKDIPNATHTSQQKQVQDINIISNNSASFGVKIDVNLKENWQSWQQSNPNGIVAYRVNYSRYNTPEEAEAGRIGNPFSEGSSGINKGTDTVQKFYEWLVTGNTFNEPKATEEYRQAIIKKLLSIDKPNILYYKELGRPSHATVLGYLIEHKEFLGVNNKQQEQQVESTPNSYEGMITPDANTIFVFGSNPEGRHGAGAAKVAREKFGAKYGQGEGLQGNAYALPTKDLRVKENNSMRSIPAEQITENIRKMYDVARQNPSKYFKVAYTHGLNNTSLNGYTGAEMIKMFKDAGPIPSNVIFSKNWTDHWNEVASNISTQPTQSIPVTQENFKPEYQLDRSKLEADTRYDQLRKDMSSRTIELRAQYIGSEFTHRIYSFSKKTLDNLKNQLEELKKGNRFQKRKEIAQLETKIFKFETAVATNDIARIVEAIGIQNIFDDIKKEFQEYAQMSVEEFEEEFGIDNPAGPNEYKKIVDNFEALKDYALYYINMRNGIRIEKEEAKKNKESIEQDDNEDDETRIAEGNTGWAFKVRNKDPYTTVSAITKQILNGIPLLDKKGNIVTDDLGNTITLNGYYAHSVLMHELCNIKSSNEFVVYDEHGKPVSFPALESMKSKYPWVNKLINHLKLQPQYISTVYSDLRQDFIPYWTIKTDGRRLKTIPINVATARESLLPKVTHNYEYGELQDENSIFDTNQKMVPDNIKLANTLLNEAEYARHQEGEAAVQECLEKTTKVLKMLGFPVDIYDITGIYNMPSGIDNIGLVIMYAQQIVDAAPNYKGDDFVDSWIKQGYGPIADLIGKVDEDCTMDTFKVGGKSYYSFSAPNFLNTLIKCLGNNNDEERRAYIDEHFKKYKWFYDEATGWKSPLLEMLYAHNGSVVADKLAVMNLISYEDKPYRDWTKKDISKAAIAAFFAEDPTLSGNYAWYQVNIFADSPVTNFVRLPKVNDSTNFKTVILQDLEKVVRQEIWRNGLVQDRKKNKAAEIVNFDKNGQSYHFFPELNTYKFTNGEYNGLTFNQAYKVVWNKLHDSNPTAFDAEISKIIQSALLDIMNKNYASFKKEVIDGRHLRQELMSDTFDKEYGGQKFTDKRFYELMENYYWNTVFAKTQIIELTSGDPAFYNGEIDFQKRYKEVYASGARLNTTLPWESGGRKFERTIYLSDLKRTSPSYQSIKELLQKAAAEGKFGKDANIAQACVDDILNKLKDINATDGQAYRSLSSYRSILKMLGKWSDSMEETFNHFQESKDSNGKWDMRDFYTVWNTLKPFVFSIDEVPTGADPEKFGTVMPVPHQNKNSEFLLLSIYGLLSESMNSSPQMRAINQFMEDYNIDVVQFESSAKVGGQGIIDINYSRKKLNALLYNKDKTFTALGKEVLSGKYKGSNDYEKYINALNQALDNKELSQEKYNKAIEDLLPDENEVYEILRTATTTDENIADKDKVKLQRDPETGFEYNPEVVHRHSYDNWMVAQPTPEHLFDTETIFGSQVRELIMSDLPDDFTVTINGKNYNKKEIREHYQALIVENLIEDFEKVRKNFDSIEDLQKALLNMIEDNPKYGREVLDAIQLVPDGIGGKMFNLPLNNPSTTAKLQEVISSMFKNQITKQHIKGGACILVSNFGFTNQLKLVYNKEGDSTTGIKYAECYMPAWSKEYFADFIDSNGNIDINEIPDNLKEIFAYRIPTEHKYSTLPLKVKGFLPIQNGSVIMLPAETVAFSGEDFDVDKKYIMMPEFNPITFKGKNKHNFVKDFIAYKESQGIPVKTDDVKIIADRIENNQELTEEDGHLEAEAYKFYKDNVSKYGTTTISKVQYDNTKTESENNRKQRNNEILDIMRGIITSPQIAEQTNHIGNFDNIKKVSRMIKILSNPVLTVEYIKENNLPENATSEIVASSLLNKSFEDLNNFMKKHTIVHNILDPRTFEYYHKQNMTGDALVGMYANNSVAHAKYQDLGITVSNGFTFVLNGEKFNKISPIRNSNGELIAFNCAEFLAASVDNAKDPVLADLQQNTNTANITAALLRMGVSIQDIGLLFNQPFIKDMIEKTGNLDKLPAFYISLTKMLKKYGQFITKENPAISSKDLVTNIIDNKDIQDNIETIKNDFAIVGDSKEVIPKLLQTIPSLRIMLRASAIAEDISILTSMSRGDSPTGALEITLGKALNQVRKVETFHRRVERGLSTLENIEKVITNKAINLNNDAKTIREKLNSKDISMLQAFYTLGIENALPLMSRYFNQLNPVVVDVFNQVSDNCKRGMLPNTAYNRTVYTADKLLKDMVTFALSDTKMFGNDEVNTYEQKRDYYIYEYPTKFMEILKDNPDLENYDTIKKLVVKKGRIQFENFTKMSTHTKNNLMSEIDLLLTSSNPVAQELIEDLIKYSYYTEQLSFGPRSFGTFISPKVLNAFPEYAEALRNVPSVMAHKGKRFIEQVYAQHGVSILNTVRGVPEKGFLLVPMKEAGNPNAPIDGLSDSDYVPYNYVKNKNGKTWNIYRYIGKTEDDKCAMYEVIPTYETIDGITYDANREAYEIKLDRNFSINRYAKLMATSGRIIKEKTAEQLAAKYSEGNFMEGFEKESLSEDEFNGLEDFSLEDSEITGLASFMGDTEVSKENTAEAENDFFSAIDAMEINDSTEASFDTKYDENKSQDTLENPMCK